MSNAFRCRVCGKCKESGLQYPYATTCDDCWAEIGNQETDGPPRDWPAIWRKQIREYVERAPMIPREYVHEVLDLIDAGWFWIPKGEPAAVVSETGWKNDEVKP